MKCLTISFSDPESVFLQHTEIVWFHDQIIYMGSSRLVKSGAGWESSTTGKGGIQCNIRAWVRRIRGIICHRVPAVWHQLCTGTEWARPKGQTQVEIWNELLFVLMWIEICQSMLSIIVLFTFACERCACLFFVSKAWQKSGLHK